MKKASKKGEETKLFPVQTNVDRLFKKYGNVERKQNVERKK